MVDIHPLIRRGDSIQQSQLMENGMDKRLGDKRVVIGFGFMESPYRVWDIQFVDVGSCCCCSTRDALNTINIVITTAPCLQHPPCVPVEN